MKPNLTPHRWPSDDALAVLRVCMCGVSTLAWHKAFGKRINRVIFQFGLWAMLVLGAYWIGEGMQQLNGIDDIKWLVNKLLWSNTALGFCVKNTKQMWSCCLISPCFLRVSLNRWCWKGQGRSWAFLEYVCKLSCGEFVCSCVNYTPWLWDTMWVCGRKVDALSFYLPSGLVFRRQRGNISLTNRVFFPTHF